MPESAFFDLPPDAFPVTIRFYTVANDELVHTLRLDAPGALYVPPLAQTFGLVYADVHFADGAVERGKP